ncbi:MAM and LDL-receptor class A domain-containing protein 1-like [Amphiura filiformis]|uniref:MAM and LDL-receptor class A domain-containing protein 1-like n=1 Tax=Amphiura filiformis TaxID=82378 RepID=UPI003B216B74
MWWPNSILLWLFLIWINTNKRTLAQTLNPIFDCNFEKVCSFAQDQAPLDDFDWIYGNGPTEAPFTGPDADNTFQNATGTYLYIRSNSTLRGTVARIHLLPSQIVTQGWARLEFFYHMSDREGPDRLGTLSVDGCGYPLWSVTGNQGNLWLKAAMTFKCEQDMPELVFEAIRGGRDSDIAIDDIIIYDVIGDPFFTTEGTTSALSTNLGESENDGPVLTTSMLVIVVVFSAIGFILLLCLVSAVFKKVVMDKL